MSDRQQTEVCRFPWVSTLKLSLRVKFICLSPFHLSPLSPPMSQATTHLQNSVWFTSLNERERAVWGCTVRSLAAGVLKTVHVLRWGHATLLQISTNLFSLLFTADPANQTHPSPPSLPSTTVTTYTTVKPRARPATEGPCFSFSDSDTRSIIQWVSKPRALRGSSAQSQYCIHRYVWFAKLLRILSLNDTGFPSFSLMCLFQCQDDDNTLGNIPGIFPSQGVSSHMLVQDTAALFLRMS